jgi:hypothetical protein
MLEKLCNQNTDNNKGQFFNNSKIDLHKEKSRNLNILNQQHNFFLDKLKLQVRIVPKWNKELKRNISIMRKLWENLKRQNLKSLIVRLKLDKTQKLVFVGCKNNSIYIIIKVNLKK